MPPERALAYNQGELLLHGPAATRPGHHFTATELTAYSKTTTRLLALLRPHPWTVLLPLEWLSPEAIAFCAGNNRLLYDLVLLAGQMEQAEQLQLDTLGVHTFLTFRR